MATKKATLDGSATMGHLSRALRICVVAITVFGTSATGFARWPVGGGGPDNDGGVDTVTAESGNVYTLGNFRGLAQFGDQELNSEGSDDIFLVKYDDTGAVQWAVTAGGSSVDRGLSMVLDPAENIYVVGYFHGTISFGSAGFGGAGGGFLSLDADGPYSDAFVAKLDSEGDWKWVRRAGGSCVDEAHAVDIHLGDDSTYPPVPASVVLTGKYNCDLGFFDDINTEVFSQDNTVTDPNNDLYDVFVARINTDGDWMWSLDRGNDDAGNEWGNSLAMTESGDVFLSGLGLNAAVTTAHYNQTFESGSGGWTSSGLWRRASDCGASSNPSSHTTIHTFYYGNSSCNFDTGDNSGSVTSPDISIPSTAPNAVLRFNSRLQTENLGSFDFARVRIRESGGSWVDIGYDESNGGSIDDDNIWEQVTIDISAFRGRTVNLQFRFETGDGVLNNFLGWHVDDIQIESSAMSGYLAKVTNTLAPDPMTSPPAWAWLRSVDTGARVTINDLIIHPSGDICVAGESGGSTNLDGVVTDAYLDGPGALASRFQPTSTGPDWGSGTWAKLGTTGVGSGITGDDDGNLYFTGSFRGSATFGTTTLNTAGGSDIFVAKVSDTGAWQWAKRAGGPLDDWGAAVSNTGVTVNGEASSLFATGGFYDQADFGTLDCNESPEQCLSSAGGSDVFVANMISAEWADLESWIVGDEVPPPPGAYIGDPIAVPDFFMGGIQVDALAQQLFIWRHDGVSGNDGKLHALKPVSEVEIRWKVSPDILNTDRIPQLGNVNWPQARCQPQDSNSCYQVHVVGSPVELEPPAGGFTYLIVIHPPVDSSLATVDESKVFRAARSGYSVILYIEDADGSLATEVVKSYPYDTAPDFSGDQLWVIGTKISDVGHEEIGRAGYVLNESAFYDPSILDREARTGVVVPVNRVSPYRTQDGQKHMVVVWYKKNFKNVYWGVKPVHYDCRWPVNPNKIVIASEQGAEVLGQDPLDPLVYTSMQLYNQPNVNEPGYNPNDEHAQFSPSNVGTGFQALFALRSDFGSNLGTDLSAASDPYALVRYRDADTQEWLFRVFHVIATGAGFDSFHYPGTAGTTVSPPYPARLLPGCSESTILGEQPGDPQPPAPFFRDYANNLWAKSEGDGGIEFHYPLQPTFFYDTDNNDQMDVAEGQCVPWLSRLGEDQGGSANPDDPIRVFYSITWPTEVPLLQVGETLLKPKRGLPNIYNQEAVRVVFDQAYEEALADETYDPDQRLVRLINPLNQRQLYFDPADAPEDPESTVCYGMGSLPSDLATEIDVNGQMTILGSVDGTIKLPYVLRSRLSYDPLNHKLNFKGSFDDSGAGEPLLLLNVMTQTEQDLLKDISGNSDWDTCVEKLYNLSRNPLQLDLVTQPCSVECNTFNFMGFEFKTCFPIGCGPRDGLMDKDLRIGFQDSNDDGFPEPVEGSGPGHALTAGFAKNTGYVTIAFNDDPSLAPLPVSLNIIKVGCLRYPEDADPPELLSTYMGEIKVIESDNVFDEQLTLRHSGDFAGQADNVEFEWFFHPDEDGTPPTPLPDPEGGQMNGWLKFPLDDSFGANEVTIGGPNILALSDNWFVVRYRGLHACNSQSEWSVWAGQPGSTPLEPRAQLAEGWVKRVTRGLNPFEARVQEFHRAPTNTYASMLMQLGQRYEGDIALSPNPDNLNEIGLIEAYETVLRRAMNLSVNSTPPVDYGPANAAILNVASRVVDFYTLLGNEAYADALDPMIGIRTDNPVYRLGSLTPTIFAFENQVASLLEEELVLLRGRDDSQGPVAARPVYNRFFWNFTSGNGEIAYAVSYNISDVYLDGVLDEKDAKLLFPQGHGDAWGHYLTAIKKYYDLLQHPFFSWDPRPEAVLVAGVPIQVDYFDERKFAKAAAAKAKTGADVVNLTYRQSYVEDPAGQWQGYKDIEPDRAWGLSEWGQRAGGGAFIDWVVGNAIMPEEDPDPTHMGIQIIDREHNDDLDEIIRAYEEIQTQMDSADRGLNPLGLSKGVVPFDIDPSQVASGHTHFEQIYDRASNAMANVVSVWDYANRLNMMLRQNQDTVEKFTSNSRSTETNFKNKLIETFGYPYEGDDLYPEGYDGPDIYHYMYVDSPVLEGTPWDIDFDPEYSNQVGPVQPTRMINAVYNPMPAGIGFFDFTGETVLHCYAAAHFGDLGVLSALLPGCNLGYTSPDTIEVEYPVWESLESGISFPKPEEWGQRRATGKVQDALYSLKQSHISLKKSLRKYNNQAQDIIDMVNTIKVTYNIRRDQITIKNIERAELRVFDGLIATAKIAKIVANRTADGMRKTFGSAKECVPDSMIVGMAGGGDVFSAVQCTIKSGENWVPFAVDILGDIANVAQIALETGKNDIPRIASLNVSMQGYKLEMFNLKGKLDAMVRQEPILRAEVYANAEAVQQAERKYYQRLAEGQRTMAGLIAFRRNSAAVIQEYRYQDMAFRIFRNDALSKYRSAFDMAARYAYLAATAYDYDTNLLSTDSQSGQDFLTDIVKERSIGQIISGKPVAGSRGLADPMGRMEENFGVLKGQMGFNNPQTETNRFSLKKELFRMDDDEESTETWRQVLRQHRVDDLWLIPEFRRYCRPFAPESAGPQPGVVIPFSTNVTFGLNFFGWPLGAGDSAYDSTHFSTKVRGVGTWFGDYADLPLSNTPRVYLVPVGADVLRSPTADNFKTREWTVVDQVLPTPFSIGESDVEEPDWIPLEDMLSGPFGEIRRFSSFLAHHFSEPFSDSEIITDSRLIGRSVWNTRWLLIIPGGTLLNDSNEGLDIFIEGQEIPGGNGERDGNGVSDVKLFFQTYAYSGN